MSGSLSSLQLNYTLLSATPCFTSLHLSTDRHSRGFCSWAVLESVVTGMSVQAFLQGSALSSFTSMSRSRVEELYGNFCFYLIFVMPSFHLVLKLQHSAITPTMPKGFSAAYQHLLVSKFFCSNYPNWVQEIFHCSFNVYFPSY